LELSGSSETMLLDVLLPIAIQGGGYTYLLPETMPMPEVGTRVLVPLAQKEVVGLVMGVHTDPLDSDIRLREIIAILDSSPLVLPLQLQLWRWMSTYYLCPLGDVMSAALPARALDRQYCMDSLRRHILLPAYMGEVELPHAMDMQQQEAFRQINNLWSQCSTILLYGVTSSGKTEVYIHLIQQALDLGQQVLYLVPEIALTTQLTDRLQRVFGAQLYVYHSRITDAQRMEIYRRQLSSSEPRVVIGARSAVFLPFRHLGLIIVDEEHEPSYKQQDPAPRYHARSVAVMLAGLAGAHTLLGTATPSIETYYNAQEGKYGLVTMTKRFSGLSMPQVSIIDLQRQYHRKEMYGHFSDPLVERIRAVLTEGHQVILFQNRRGYAPYMQCVACGQVPSCPDCDAHLTLHLRERLLRCHYCGRDESIPPVCPHCGGEMRIHGFGTERIEEEVRQLFPTARVERMDWDTTRRKDEYQQIIQRFAQHDTDILIGTQMVSKGLHFDHVRLVAVLSADALINQPDFRSEERAFQLLEQVAGRAGRSGQQGEVYLQTFSPSHPVYECVVRHDYLAQYQSQLADRQHFGYPPFRRLITLTLRHRQPKRVDAAALLLMQQLQAVFGRRCSAIITPSVERIQTWHLRQLVLKIETRANLARAKQQIVDQVDFVLAQDACKGVVIYADVDY